MAGKQRVGRHPPEHCFIFTTVALGCCGDGKPDPAVPICVALWYTLAHLSFTAVLEASHYLRFPFYRSGDWDSKRLHAQVHTTNNKWRANICVLCLLGEHLLYFVGGLSEFLVRCSGTVVILSPPDARASQTLEAKSGGQGHARRSLD